MDTAKYLSFGCRSFARRNGRSTNHSLLKLKNKRGLLLKTTDIGSFRFSE
jgi:hypothetical protein